MTTLDIANYLRSLTPRERENLKRGIQLEEATASAELAKETKNGDDDDGYVYRSGYMLCVGCVKQFPESERHGQYCDDCFKCMNPSGKWKETTNG